MSLLSPPSRPETSLSAHIARELERDYCVHPANVRRGKMKRGARGIKRFVFATAGGVKRVSVATGRRGVRVGRRVKDFTKWAYLEWANLPVEDVKRKHGRGVSKSQISRPLSAPVTAPMSTPIPIPVSIVTDIPFTPAVCPSPQRSQKSSRGAIDELPSGVNPSSSIEDILRAYLVRLGPFREHLPPPGARAIFPSNYNTVNRIYIRQRPGSARPFSRASNRPFPRMSHNRYMSTSRSSTRSDASSDVLGLTPIYERTGEMPSPFLRRPRGGQVYVRPDTRPDTASSSVPKLRTREQVVEVVSVATQTSPPSTPIATMPTSPEPKRRGHRRGASRLAQARDSLHLSKSSDIGPGVGRKPQVASEYTEDQQPHRQGNDGNYSYTDAARKVSFSTREERISRREEAVRNILERTSALSGNPVSDYENHRPAQTLSPSVRSSVNDMGDVSDAMQQYYRSQGRNVNTPPPVPRRSDMSSMQPWPADKKLVYVDDATPRRCSSLYTESHYSRQSHVDLLRARSDPSRSQRSQPPASRTPSQHLPDVAPSFAPRSPSPIPDRPTIPSNRMSTYSSAPTDLSIYHRHLDPRLSHISIDTAHTRNPSQPYSVANRLSHGPLSLTADRYRGAVSQPREASSVPRATHRKKPDLSIDTTLSLQWNAPLLRRNKGSFPGLSVSQSRREMH